jgi:broad specificity phosphatase PhoE
MLIHKGLQTFYFMRHAQTDAHVQKRICGGEWDLPLNQEGILQANEAALRYLDALSDVKTVVSSPLTRAKMTAAAFAGQLKLPLVTIEEFKEWSLGEWDKKPFEEVPELFTRLDDPPQGEPRAQFEQRVLIALRHALDLAGPVLIVSHGAVWFSLLKILHLETHHVGSCVPFRFRETKKGLCIEDIST